MSEKNLERLDWLINNVPLITGVVFVIGLIMLIESMSNIYIAFLFPLSAIVSVSFILVTEVSNSFVTDYIITDEEPGSYVDKTTVEESEDGETEDKNYYILSQKMSWRKYATFKVLPVLYYLVGTGILTAFTYYTIEVTPNGSSSIGGISVEESLFMMIFMFAFIMYVGALGVSLIIFFGTLKEDHKLLSVYQDWNEE